MRSTGTRKGMDKHTTGVDMTAKANYTLRF